MTLPRLLLILFLFLVPYWGVFFFRFSIVNGFIIVNLIFFLMVHAIQRIGGAATARSQVPRASPKFPVDRKGHREETRSRRPQRPQMTALNVRGD